MPCGDAFNDSLLLMFDLRTKHDYLLIISQTKLIILRLLMMLRQLRVLAGSIKFCLMNFIMVQ